ncbi:uncharacterized protein LOC133390598 [Rhineura floridana]|uniref:uncharacterized protein LOC133390598 n=1 Tax=Rhineura floridana TaxID=261503 RepID=UPI002AC7F2B1|nr:uncharacterized protein LOC133390598 [Rhineura floridana]XP_061495507.1 uncharacterized protein LOC133390598 [Rhineura floridana]
MSPRILTLRDQLLSFSAPFENFDKIVKEIRPLVISSRAGHSVRPNQGWFDEQCAAHKRILAKAIRKLRKVDSLENFISCIQLRREYKNLLRAKKYKHIRQLWMELGLATIEKNSARFWTLAARGTKGGKGFIDNPITSSQWYIHFFSFFSLSIPRVPLGTAHNIDPLLLSFCPEWDPVTPDEIYFLINSLPAKKAPGEDMLPAEVFKSNPAWWCPVFATMFTCISHYGKIPQGWGVSIVVPIHKRGSKVDSKHFRPINLLSVVAKLYSKYLLCKLEFWATETSITAEEQAEFIKGKYTIDQCFILHHLIQKYFQNGRKELFVAFVDFTSAFNLIDRGQLWQKLSATNIDRHLLYTNVALLILLSG